MPRRRPTDGFLQLVPETYGDDEVVEWEPAPAPVSKPGEPGNLGISYFFRLMFALKFNERKEMSSISCFQCEKYVLT